MSLLASRAILALLFLVGPQVARSQPQAPLPVSDEPRPVEATWPVRITGQVILPDGRPAVGAVVVSSAGGLAEVGEDGSYVLEVRVAPGVSALQVSAVANGSQGPLTDRRTVPGVVPGETTPSAPLHPTSTPGCTPQWLPTFGQQQGVNGVVLALAVHDDGSGAGSALYVGGEFSTAGGLTAYRIARWDGQVWSTLGSGMVGNSKVNALAVHDDGSGAGPALYAGGQFTVAGGVTVNHIARWDGQSWSALGSGMGWTVNALVVHDDGSGAGPALYAGGLFTSAGGVAAEWIAKWDGQSWSALGSGVSSYGVNALAVYDDGSGAGPALYAGGKFPVAGDGNRGLARWDGQSWSTLARGPIVAVHDLTVYDDGSGGGPALYMGGKFTSVEGVTVDNVARWDGQSWSPLGSGTSSTVRTLMVHDDGAGSALYVGGLFMSAGGVTVNRIAKWDGQSWSPLGSGVNSNEVQALAVYDDGSGGGPAIHVGGQFWGTDGTSATHIAKWDGQSWSALGSGMGSVLALTVHDDGSGAGPALYAGGPFFWSAGGVSIYRIAKWDGQSWSPLGSGMNGPVHALTVHDDGSGSGPALYAAGFFSAAGGLVARNIARWDGQSWSPLGSGMHNTLQPPAKVYALASYDDGSGSGPALYAGGYFTYAGGVTVNHIAKWDGQGWSSLGSGMTASVRALAVYDDGSGAGSVLYAGGGFGSAGGVAANLMATWDGQSWSPLGSEVGGPYYVHALTVHDDGSGAGPALYAGGQFASAGGSTVNHIARWDGQAWSPLGSGMNNHVYAIGAHDDGSGDGPALYAGGSFTSAGGMTANHIARWDGQTWSPLESGMSNSVFALEGYDDGLGGGPGLYAGGAFTTSPAGDSGIAKWGCAPLPSVGTAFCFGDGSGTPCPCLNPGEDGRGCANQPGSAGGLLIALGSDSVGAADLLLRGSDLVPNQFGLFFQGTARLNNGQGIPLGDGLLCVSGSVIRLELVPVDSLGMTSSTLDLVSAGNISPGHVRSYQLWYRNTPASPCGVTNNLTNALEITWLP